ncbi:MAG: heme ABC exporter ATP-binding protein CcmA [Acidimicrobiales bacterium]
MDSVLSLRGAVAVLGRFPALAGVDLEVTRGEVVLVSGPNGAGKSTLLRLCAGLVPLAEGEALILGCDLRRQRRQLRRKVGYLGHANGLYAELTAEENVRFWAASVGAPAADVGASLDRLEVAPRVRSLPVAQLSAGQRRRAALAALVVRRPELWLLDEPHTGLDVSARALLDGLMGEAVRGGATVLAASHEWIPDAGLASREVRLQGGVVSSTAERSVRETCRVP